MSAQNPIVVLGVTGSIAAYKAADITSQLVKAACNVHAVMTESATRFVGPLTLQTLSRNPVITSSDNAQTSWKPGHIELADSADLLLIAPATANVIAELAHGLANHPLTEIALAIEAPVLVAPAMNGKMWNHPATQANVTLLRERGVQFVDPEPGILACGYEGDGRLAAVETIVSRALQILKK